jgi:hypothetical protein
VRVDALSAFRMFSRTHMPIRKQFLFMTQDIVAVTLLLLRMRSSFQYHWRSDAYSPFRGSVRNQLITSECFPQRDSRSLVKTPSPRERSRSQKIDEPMQCSYPRSRWEQCHVAARIPVEVSRHKRPSASCRRNDTL